MRSSMWSMMDHMEHGSTLKRKGLLTHSAMWLNLEVVILRAISIHLYVVPKTNSQRKDRRVDARGWRGCRSYWFNRNSVSVWEDGEVDGW